MTLRLFLLSPVTHFAALVNQASFTYPIAECEFDGVTTGAFTDLFEGMTVLFGTSAGADDLGRQRIRKAADADTIFFGRSSQGAHDGEVNLQNDAFITALWDYRVWAKMPFIDTSDPDPEITTIFKDHDIAVGSFTDNVPPVSNCGVGIAGTIDSGTSKLQVTLPHEANTSFALSGTISTYLWGLPSGVTLDSGATSDSQITVNCDPGFYWVKLTVTDSNSKTHESRCPIFARDPASDSSISSFNIESHKIRPDGQELNIKILEAIAEGTYPDGTLVMLWEDEPSGPTDRSHMIFIGWHHTDPTRITARRTGILTGTTFTCKDVAGRMRALPGFPQSISSIASPLAWTQMSSPHIDKFIHYLMYWHSTGLELADWSNSGVGSSFPFVLLWSDGDSIWSQTARRAKNMVPDYVLGCNTLGQLTENIDPILQATGSRTATIQTTLTEADWTSIRYTHQRPPRVHWHRGNAIEADATVIDALFCVAPGDTPGQGEISQEQGEQLAQNQTDLNVTEGNRYARLNAEENLFRITLTEGNDKDIEPADMTWVRLDIAAAYAAQRGLAFSNERGLVHEVNIKYSHGRTGFVRTVELLWERETDGPPAVTFIPPVPPPFDDTIDDWPDDEADPDPTVVGDGFGTAYVMLSTGLARTRDLSAASPTWVDISSGITGIKYDFILDPWQPKTRAFTLTSAGVFRGTDMETSTPTWTNVLTVATILSSTTGNGDTILHMGPKIQMSINVEDYIGFTLEKFDGGGNDNWFYYIYSTDAGTTWNFTFIVASIGIASQDTKGTAWDIVPHSSDGSLTIYIIMSYIKSPIKTVRVYRSTDSGAAATWFLRVNQTVAGGSTPTCCIIPYKNNEDGLEVWASIRQAEESIRKSTDGFATWPAAIDLPRVSKDYTVIKRLGIEIYVDDNNQVVVWNADNFFFKSTDGGISWSEILFSGYVRATHGAVSGVGGFPTISSRYYMVTDERHVFVSIDGGTTWIEKTGNLQSIITSDGVTFAALGIRVGVIVPVWLAE